MDKLEEIVIFVMLAAGIIMVLCGAAILIAVVLSIFGVIPAI